MMDNIELPGCNKTDLDNAENSTEASSHRPGTSSTDAVDDLLIIENNMLHRNEKNSRPRTMHKIKSSWESGTKTIGRQTASLVSTVGTWTSTVFKTDRENKGEKAEEEQSQDEEGKYWGLMEKRGNLAQKMKTLLKIGEGRRVDPEAGPEPMIE